MGAWPPLTHQDVQDRVDANDAYSGAWVYNSITQNIANATIVTLGFDNEFYDSGSLHDLVTNNGRITVLTASKYLCIATVAFDTSAVGLRLAGLKQNGTDKLYSQLPTVQSANGTYIQAIAVLNCAAGDYVEALAYQSSGAPLGVLGTSTGSSLSVSRVRV